MSAPNIGNVLYRLTSSARHALFDQGELAQLTYGAFDVVANNVRSDQSEVIEISFPVGYRPDKTPILSTRKYAKDELIRRYQHLAYQQLPVNGLVQLVTIVEALLGDVVRTVITRYPQKLGAKRSVSLQLVLEARTIEDIHLRATDALLNDLTYKSPSEFAESLDSLLSINLLECPAFHKYIEIKATRDIFIHNRGTANDTYVRKSGSHARANAGRPLPVDISYFLESYEFCLQLTEWLESELHEHWHSSELEDSRSQPTPSPVEPLQPLLEVVEELGGVASPDFTPQSLKAKRKGRRRKAAP
jgi:hypothetical protein